MATNNRAKLISKLATALKKSYSLPPATPSRPLLEHALYASLLEDCPADLAEEGLVKLEQDYFDWNEVRVTTVTEISGVLSSMPEPQKAAARLKANLQGIFEEFYSFDLDHLKKENLGKAVGKFEKLPSMTPFVLSYIIQHGLGGHSIPIDYSAMVIMLVTGIASQEEAAAGRVPGLERAIPKTKGIEFAALLHQPAVALSMNPKDKKARAFLESVAKGSSAQLDEWLDSKEAAQKRVAKRKAAEREVAKLEAEEAVNAVQEQDAIKSKKKPVRSAAKSTSTTHKPRAAKAKADSEPTVPSDTKTQSESKSSSKKSAAKKTASKSASKTVAKKASTKAKSKPATKAKATTKESSSTKKTAAKKKAASSTSSKSTAKQSKPASTKKKTSNRKLTKRKPR